MELNDDTFEDIFWLQVFGDHVRIFLGTLDSEEKEWLVRAQYLRDEADAHEEKARRGKLKREEAMKSTIEVRDYKIALLEGRMSNQIKLNLPPFFINHMLDELEEYLIILTEGESSPILEQHKLWLNDAGGHVASLIADLDITEKLLKKKLKKLMKTFECLHKSALETIGFDRATVPEGWQERLNQQAREQIDKFVEHLREMEELQANEALMSRIPKLVFDHMQREEAYYLSKILEQLGAPKAQIDKQRARAIAPRQE
jgi:hypothetical protein